MAEEPGFIVGVQRFAVGKTEQCGAVVDLGGQFGAGLPEIPRWR